MGNGVVTLRMRSQSFEYPTGETIALEILQNPWTLLDGGSTTVARNTVAPDIAQSEVAATGSLDDALAACEADFASAIEARNADGAVRAALALEQAIHEWSVDTLQSDAADRARAALRSMISSLGDAAVSGVRNPRDVVSPYVEAMLAVRATVRAEKRYDLSDIIRDAFASLQIEVRDTPTGVEWDLHAD